MSGSIQFISKIHKANGLSFYLPTSFVKWFELDLPEYNNTITIDFKNPKKESLVLNNVVFGKYKETYRGSFYPWHMPQWKKGKPYLITVELRD